MVLSVLRGFHPHGLRNQFARLTAAGFGKAMTKRCPNDRSRFSAVAAAQPKGLPGLVLALVGQGGPRPKLLSGHIDQATRACKFSSIYHARNATMHCSLRQGAF